jgi:NADPH:quinone reductase-like Zn-dependent oxidoreductase
MTFRAVRADKTDAGHIVKLVDMDESELMDGDVTIRVTHSTVNYKDGLALSGNLRLSGGFPWCSASISPGLWRVPDAQTSLTAMRSS